MNVYLKESQIPAKACIIWMHGLGADASDMAGLAEQPALSQLPLRHIFMNAPVRPVTINGGIAMRAWYDIVGFNLNDREDIQGIQQSQQLINEAIHSQLSSGFTSNQIILAGFSQGGAMALYTALHHAESLGGVIALSAYLPLALHCQFNLPKETEIFMGMGRFDSIVRPEWTQYSAQLLGQQGYRPILNEYPMEHSICLDEIFDLSGWLNSLIGGGQE